MNNSIFDDNMDEDEVKPFPTFVIATLDTEWQLLQLQLLIEDKGDTYQKVKVQGQGLKGGEKCENKPVHQSHPAPQTFNMRDKDKYHLQINDDDDDDEDLRSHRVSHSCWS